jgi:hypothetical protein
MKDYKPQILALLHERGSSKTICPSELLEGEDKQIKELMAEVRESAKELALNGEIEITQKGEVLDPQAIKGPIRLRLKV